MVDESSLTRSNAAIRASWAALVAAVVVPAALFLFTAWENRIETERAAEARAQRTAIILREHALKVIETAELAIAQIDHRIEGLNWDTVEQSTELQGFLVGLEKSLVQVSRLTLLDSSGWVRNSSDASLVAHKIDSSNLDDFSRLAAADLGTIISRPHAEKSGTLSFDIAQRRSTLTDMFDGVILATVDPQYFATFYHSVVEGNDDSVALVLQDGTTLCRWPADEAKSRPRLGFLEAIARGEDGVYRTAAAGDSRDRIVAFAKVGRYPLYVTYGLSRASILESWYLNLRRYAVFAVLASLALVTITWSGLRRAQALQRSEERYRTLYTQTAVPIHTLDAEARVISVSDRWLDLLGYSREEVIGRPVEEFLPQHSAYEFRTTIWPRLLAGDEVRDVEREFRRKSGETIIALVSGHTERDRAGKLRRVHAVVVDITSRKAAEQALRREKELSEFLLRSSTDGIIGIDRSFRVTLWNPAATAITGFKREEAVGRDLFELFPWLSGTSTEAAWRGALEGRRAEKHDRAYTIPATRKRGYYEARYAPIYGEEGEIIGAVGFIRDVTERRQMEEVLRQSQKMEAVGQLTGGIAHDFNNLLTVIIGNLQLVSNELPANEKLQRQIAAVQRAADRGARLTAQLLAFSRRQNLRPEVRNINDLIRDFRSLTQRAAGGAIEIVFSLQPQLWAARVDPAQFEAAVLNLVVNARDALDEHGVITISTANVSLAERNVLGMPPGDYVRVSVIDEGAGMTPEVLARASEPFFTTKGVGKGTGLGLSMVYGFLRQSEGELRIDSEPGKGTRVDMYLPRTLELPARSSAGQREALSRAGSESVLVVEDEPDVREAVGTMLQDLGYDVVAASNGPEALALLLAGRPVDLLFSDIVMTGGMSGVELARRVRQDFPDIRILLNSGYPLHARDEEGPPEFAVLLKPYNREQLSTAIRDALLSPLPPGAGSERNASNMMS